MRSLAEDYMNESQSVEERLKKGKKRRDPWAEFPLKKPISADQMLLLQKNSAKAEIFLKESYQKDVILALGDKFKGD